jgi:hypothetical protein
VDQVLDGATPEVAAEVAVSMRQAADHCRSGYMCYYPEVRWSR